MIESGIVNYEVYIMNFTVLIVDDEAMPRTVLREHIPWEELSVTKVCLATDGAEAVEQARRFQPVIKTAVTYLNSSSATSKCRV